jgi:hypothetical protein
LLTVDFDNPGWIAADVLYACLSDGFAAMQMSCPGQVWVVFGCVQYVLDQQAGMGYNSGLLDRQENAQDG